MYYRVLLTVMGLLSMCKLGASMNILMLTAGSRGDIQPFIALGLGLKDEGHHVTICTHQKFESFISSYGLDYAYMDDGLLELANSAAARKAIAESSGILGWFKAVRMLSQKAADIQRQMMDEAWQAAQDIDFIIFHPKVIGALDIAEKLQIPCATVLTAPFMIATGELPHFMFPSVSLGSLYNRFTYALANMLGKCQYMSTLNDWRQRKLDLAQCSYFSDRLKQYDEKPIPVLHCFSQELMKRPSDWSHNAEITGFWFLKRRDQWQPPKDLVQFLDAGSKPIYIGFGSMVPENVHEFTQIVVAAIKESGKRAIIAGGWGALQDIVASEHIFYIDKVPHDWLFEHVSGVVHHGGAGTTAAALKAGVPQFICPFIADQFFWGQQIFAKGLGPEPIAQKKLNVENFVHALSMLDDVTMHDRAQVARDNVLAEGGVQKAIELLTDHMKK